MAMAQTPDSRNNWVNPNRLHLCFFLSSRDTTMPGENPCVNRSGGLFEKNIPTMKRSGRNSDESRQGSQSGWTKQGVQVPDEIARIFRDDAASLGYGGVKYLGAAALAIITGMTKNQQRAVANYVRDKTWNDPANLEPERVLHILGMFQESPYDIIPHYLQSTTIDMSYDKAYEIWKRQREEDAKSPSLAELARQELLEREKNNEDESSNK